MRICPKCGKKYPDGENRCRASYGTPAVKCNTATIEYIEWTEEDEAEAQKDLEEGILEDPFEDYEEKPKAKPKAKTEVEKKK